MMIELGFILSRIYALGGFLLTFNMLSQMVFNSDEKYAPQFRKTLIFIVVWPLAIFSPSGRRVIFSQIEKL